MIQLEDQLRRYASDVAGPPVAAPPADLAETSGPQPNQGRWLLVAALVLFVAGLSATVVLTGRDQDEAPPVASQRPDETVDSVEAPPPLVSFGNAFGPCGGSSSVTGMHFSGPAGDGICLDPHPTTIGNVDGSTSVQREYYVVADGVSSGGRAPTCPRLEDGRISPEDLRSDVSGVVTLVVTPPTAMILRFNDGAGPSAETVEIPTDPGWRWAAVRTSAIDPSLPAVAFDEAGRPVTQGGCPS